MFSRKVLTFVFVLALSAFLTSSASAQGFELDGPHTVHGNGATEAIARQAALDAMDMKVDDFEDSLDAGDYVAFTGISSEVWDPNTMKYSITFLIWWVDNP